MLKKTLSKVQSQFSRPPKKYVYTYIPNSSADIKLIIKELKRRFGIECEQGFLSFLSNNVTSPLMRSEMISVVCENERKLIFLDPEKLEECTLSILESVILFSLSFHGNIRSITFVMMKPVLPELEVLHPTLSVIKAMGNYIEFNAKKDIVHSISKSFECELTTEKTVPHEVVNEGIAAVRRFLGYKDKGSVKIFQARGMIVGCAGAGKTTLLHRMIGQDVKRVKDEVKSTRGLQIYRSVFVFDNHTLVSLNKSKVEELDSSLRGRSVNVEQNRVTMFDFAGQAAYYACHQIYLSPRCFYLLVLDMSRDMNTLVDDEVCNYKKSVFSTWTFRDYLLFWLKSIHTFTGPDVPVILVGTHADGMSEEDVDEFYTNVWRIVSEENKSLLHHIDNERTFTIGFDDKYLASPSKILRTISKIIQEQKYWGEELPSSWVVLLSRLRKTKLKLCYLEKLKGLKSLNMSISELEDSLKFFHESGYLLFFNESPLKEIIILDIQWFVDAFKHIIADERHVQIDIKRTLIDEWDSFNRTGELSETLLEAMWKSHENNEYLRYKQDITVYMERLGMMTPILKDTERENCPKAIYYVPCMNKRPVNMDQFLENFSKDLIHCFRFNFLPVFIFHRLVVACMSLHKWKLNISGQEKNIYQSAAAFVFANHHVILATSRNDIQVQVFRLKPDSVDQLVVFTVLEEISNLLENLSTSFYRYSQWILGFKCKSANICDDSDNSFTDLEDVDLEDNLFCTSCHETHLLIDKETLEDYIKFVEDRSGFLASKNNQEHLKSKVAKNNVTATERLKLNFLQMDELIQLGREALKMVFDKCVPPDTLSTHLESEKQFLRQGQYRFSDEQLRVIFPEDGTKPNSKNFDITILYKLLRNTTNICETDVWRKDLRFEHTSRSDDVERIQQHRNKIAHSTSKELGDDEFKSRWLDLSMAIKRLSEGVLNRRVEILAKDNMKDN